MDQPAGKRDPIKQGTGAGSPKDDSEPQDERPLARAAYCLVPLAVCAVILLVAEGTARASSTRAAPPGLSILGLVLVIGAFVVAVPSAANAWLHRVDRYVFWPLVAAPSVVLYIVLRQRGQEGSLVVSAAIIPFMAWLYGIVRGWSREDTERRAEVRRQTQPEPVAPAPGTLRAPAEPRTTTSPPAPARDILSEIYGGPPRHDYRLDIPPGKFRVIETDTFDHEEYPAGDFPTREEAIACATRKALERGKGSMFVYRVFEGPGVLGAWYYGPHELEPELKFLEGLQLDDRELNFGVRGAYAIAKVAHQGHTRDDGRPYIEHPLSVVRALVQELGVKDPQILAAAFLHDVLEDSEFTTHQLSVNYYVEQALPLVEALTRHPHGAPGPKPPFAVYMQQVVAAGSAAIALKLADRLCNLRDSARAGLTDKTRQYVVETEQVVLPAVREAPGVLWQGIPSVLANTKTKAPSVPLETITKAIALVQHEVEALKAQGIG